MKGPSGESPRNLSSGTNNENQRGGIAQVSVKMCGALGCQSSDPALIASSTFCGKKKGNTVLGSIVLKSASAAQVRIAVDQGATNLSPSWTYRFASTGATYSALGPSGSHFAAFTSKSAVKGISNWKPSKPTALLLTFDSKGVLVDAKSAVGTPIALGYSKDLGIVLMSTSQTGVSIFRLT